MQPQTRTKKPKITQTFADKAGNGHAGDTAVPDVVPEVFCVEAAHEPLKGENWSFTHTYTPAVITGVVVSPPPVITGGVVSPPVVAPVKVPLKVAIIGTAPSSRHLAPYDDKSWKIWSCSPGNMNQIPRWDVWFEIHSNLMWPENKHYGEPYINWLKSITDRPIYMQDQILVPHAIPYPVHEIVAEYGRYFFTSSFAWMMALAIKQGAEEIALYGVDMASRDEYILQRPGGQYFMEIARQRGIKVTVPYESDLAQPPPLYGFSDSSPLGRKLAARRTEVRGRISTMQAELSKLQQNVTYLQGADEDLDYVQSIWGSAMDEVSGLQAEIAKLKTENADLRARLGG